MRVLAALAIVVAGRAQRLDVGHHKSIGVAYICSAENRAKPKGPETLTILPGMGSGGFTIATSNPQAQVWFDYGIKLYHAFYHDEAKVAFDKAAGADPACAMCAWGQALAHGSTMNYDAEEAEITKARAFADQAARLSAKDAGPRTGR